MRSILVLMIVLGSLYAQAANQCALVFQSSRFDYSSWKRETVETQPEHLQAEEFSFLFKNIQKDPNNAWFELMPEIMTDFYTDYAGKYTNPELTRSKNTFKQEMLLMNMYSTFIKLLMVHSETPKSQEVNSIQQVIGMVLESGRAVDGHYKDRLLETNYREQVFEESDRLDSEALNYLLRIRSTIEDNVVKRRQVVKILKGEFQFIEDMFEVTSFSTKIELFNVNNPLKRELWEAGREDHKSFQQAILHRNSKLQSILLVLGVRLRELATPEFNLNE